MKLLPIKEKVEKFSFQDAASKVTGLFDDSIMDSEDDTSTIVSDDTNGFITKRTSETIKSFHQFSGKISEMEESSEDSITTASDFSSIPDLVFNNGNENMDEESIIADNIMSNDEIVISNKRKIIKLEDFSDDESEIQQIPKSESKREQQLRKKFKKVRFDFKFECCIENRTIKKEDPDGDLFYVDNRTNKITVEL